MEACLVRQYKTVMREGNRVKRAMQPSLRVAGGRRSQYTKGEWGRIHKTVERWDRVSDKTLTLATEPRLVAVPD